MPPVDRWIGLDYIRLHAREWLPAQIHPNRPVFLLFHGLSSNAATWDQVADQLVQAGHRVISVDQRGHGLSEKPDHGYDFETIAGDVRQVIDHFGLENVILAGQSWGGNVLLEVAARYPGKAVGYIFVDGGFLHLNQRGAWNEVSREFRPPDLAGIPKTLIEDRIAEMHPTWGPKQISVSLQNFEIMPDGTVRPWLALDRHMAILRALYNQDVPELFSQVVEPVLICAAADGSEREPQKRKQVELATALISDVEVRWFDGAAHDIHVDRPKVLAAVMQKFSEQLSKRLQ